MANPTTRSPSCPPDVLQALPWFLEGSLEDQERGRVEAHLASCAACRREIAAMEGGDATATEDLELPQASETYARVLDRMGESGAHGAASPVPLRAASDRRRRAVRTLIAAGLAGLVLAVGVALGRSWLQPPGAAAQEGGYQPASALEAPPLRGAPDEIDVVFRDGASLESLTRSLRAIGGTVVSGPSRLGVYRVRLRDDGDGAAAAALLKSDDSGVASFAEPVLR